MMFEDHLGPLFLAVGGTFLFFHGCLRPRRSRLGERPSRPVLYRAFRRAARRLRTLPIAGPSSEADLDPCVLHGARPPRRYARR